jgi:hypothetical protein
MFKKESLEKFGVFSYLTLEIGLIDDYLAISNVQQEMF